MQNKMRESVRLAPYTTFHIGGPAEFFLEVHSEEELVEAVTFARAQKLPLHLLGGGSNLVVSDNGIEGLVIRNLANNTPLIDSKQGFLKVSSGFPLSKVTKLAYQNSLTGLEFSTGIPGTMGGAIYGNAGAYGKNFGDILISADILRQDGKIITVPNEFFEFSYRFSILKRQPFIVLNATLSVEKGNKELIRTVMVDIIKTRKVKHPPHNVGSAGSFFKNLDPNPGETRRRAAGEVLEKAGAKNLSVGGAFVYSNHANFIVNYGEATAADVKKLAQAMKDAVYRKFSIVLQEEVIYIGK